ncbi:hypothetical protein B0H16DRAFT_1723097 [Mycena metata]|uniref:Uncharacterized protein n=1 Tax=Mycena metata TaxID=1033252 RepID=A0AAD7NC20_9AGAR|nr:hypothetical protein B0H16DRAFT_1723097 [Mycena metata]
MSSVSARPPPPSFDESSASGSDDATPPPPPPPPKPKPRPKKKVVAFKPSYMTIVDDVVYEDRTRDNNKSLDPFIHLRGDDLQQTRRLLVDPGLLPKLAKSESKLRRALEHFLYFLPNLSGAGGRPWPDELSRFLYPLRYLLAHCDSTTLAFAGRNIELIPPENPELENTHLGADWTLPPTISYWAKVRDATDEDRAALAKFQKSPSPPPSQFIEIRSSPAPAVETKQTATRDESAQVPVRRYPAEEEKRKKKRQKEVVIPDSDTSVDDSKPKRARGKQRKVDDSDNESTHDTPRRPGIKPGGPPKPNFPDPPANPPKETIPATGFRGLYSENLQDFPKSIADMKNSKSPSFVPPKSRWMFDHRAITLNSWWRNPHDAAPTTPLGRPWAPPPNPKGPTNVLPDKSHQQGQEILVRLLDDPGFSCLCCILHACFLRVPLASTSAAPRARSRSAATVRSSPPTSNSNAFRLESLPWFEMGHQRTWQFCVDLHTSFIRAHTAQRLAVIETQDFHQRFIAFTEHCDFVVSNVGTERFLERFTESNSTESLRERLQSMVLSENAIQDKHAALQTEEHVKSFDTDPAAHHNKTFSGPERHIPTNAEQRSSTTSSPTKPLKIKGAAAKSAPSPSKAPPPIEELGDEDGVYEEVGEPVDDGMEGVEEASST